jgi:hypothetical protein
MDKWINYKSNEVSHDLERWKSENTLHYGEFSLLKLKNSTKKFKNDGWEIKSLNF